MNLLSFLAVLTALCLGCLLGWLLHAARDGARAASAEAQLRAMHDSERLLREALTAANEDSARRHSGALNEQVSNVVTPLREAVGTLAEQVRQVERSRISAYSGLMEQVAGMSRTSQALSAQTGQLVQALRAPQVRGRWGELQLERVVELAGMREHCDFTTQAHTTHDGNDGVRAVRPDLLVHLAGGKNVVVDAKVPFAAFLDATEAQSDEARAGHLKRHASQLRAHVDQLSAKAYWTAFSPSPEFVVLFVPGDPFLDAALGADSELLEYAFSRNVVLATPTSLIALLRTVAHTWRQEALSRDAAKIHTLGAELYNRLGVLANHMDRLGGQLGKSVESFNSTVASMESRVLVTARKLHELPAFDTEPPTVDTVDLWPRGIAHTEIYATRSRESEAS
ncbi:DNA recombination protein RmuC [Hoyosella subflava]|uniref:Possible DNA recombination protein, RmuC family protein n=1 Tax=Hoyosella subflava (strain DSM 45089 / JCM 17490 / NBRC 109087 / DQS3-9A1) TaxID=443218 RepID=F6EQ16_HOYSD|nr:DNA recombination protein RmuC [Hoyosella subflava]AEF41837.1 Possible DNA recombination protein, RmuC family protein [Hoyosella subflava DQS3-9A1]